MKRPADVPLSEWPRAWLVLEVAALVKEPLYIMATDAEKEARGWPVTADEMRAYIAGDRIQFQEVRR